ncbi:MAG: DNA methyltransferase, partial [Aestuariivirga sp.]|uniref:DNA methyltransferase n=1 Tax=Aestuariivirga sp. TaxID=2650926 RepID=UPI0038D0A4A0
MLTRSDIIANASLFSNTWKDAIDEDADAKSFWDELFQVFGTPRKNVARFEAPVKRPDGTTGYIDLLWKGKLLVEHKSRGKSLEDARKQAQEYILNLKPQDRPEWLAVSDFENFQVVNQKDGSEYYFKLADLPKHIDTLGFIGGFVPKKPSKSTPVNIEAVEILGDIYDSLKAGGYNTHELPQLMVRLLFILFSEDTAIFEPDQFRDLILDTKEDATDLGPLLNYIFDILNTPPASRQKTLPAPLATLPYINGALFSTHLHSAAMTPDVRAALVRATEFDWTQISPAIFGSLFQSVMESAERRALGAHYTSEDDILKLIKPLFLDDLEAELERIIADKSSKRNARLDEFHNKLASLRFLDPACGCGNFLIIAYRELRRLEKALLLERYKENKVGVLDISLFVKLNVDMMYGIELEEFPEEIAKVGMWLMDHICNVELAAIFGKSFTRLPLNKTATIKCANALTVDWSSVLPPEQCSYIIGNPPFVGAKFMDDDQRAQVAAVFAGIKNAGLLDFVCAWYVLAARYMQTHKVECAFVSTNSITQGE